MKMKSFTVLALLVACGLAAEEADMAVRQHDFAYYQDLCDTFMPVNCVVTTAWAFGPCSTHCGQGTSTRSRTVIHDACNGGLPCPLLVQTEECMKKVS
jgi:hypothetical protein